MHYCLFLTVSTPLPHTIAIIVAHVEEGSVANIFQRMRSLVENWASRPIVSSRNVPPPPLHLLGRSIA